MDQEFFDPSMPPASRTVSATVGDETTTYVGYAAPGSDDNEAVWQIRKIVENSSTKASATYFAEGTGHYKFKWTDRATLTYS